MAINLNSNVIQWNINGIRSHIEDLEALVHDTSPCHLLARGSSPSTLLL